MNNLNRIFFLFATLVFSLVISGAVAAEDTEAPEVEIYPSGGTYYEPIYVYFEDLNQEDNVIVYYTLDESEPTTNSPYINIQTDGPIFINSPGETTIKFMASDEAGNLADIKSETYFLVDEYPPVYNSGNNEYYYNHPVSKELYAWDNFDDNPKAYYTINGEDPNTSSTLYTGPINMPEGQTILKFFFMDDSDNSSEIFTEIYNIDSIAPTATANPIGGTHNNLNTIELTASDNIDLNPLIYYTINGEDPIIEEIDEFGTINRYLNPLAMVYNGSITIQNTGQLVLKFIALDEFGNYSPKYTESYNIIDNISPTAITTPFGGIYYNNPIYVNIQVNDNYTGSTIYYTLDGTDPTLNSEIFFGLRLPEGITQLKYLVVDAAGNQSPIYTENYTLMDNAPPVVNANPTSCVFDIYYNWYDPYDPDQEVPDFIYDGSVNLSATDIDLNPIIYYTIDGTDPTSNGLVYQGTLTMPAGKTVLKFYAIDNKGQASEVKTETYYVSYSYDMDLTDPIVDGNPNGWVYDKSKYVELTATDEDDPIVAIYYTLDGSDPIKFKQPSELEPGQPIFLGGWVGNGTLYTAPILIEKTTMLKFAAINMAGNASPVYFDIYIIGSGSVDNTPPTPSASVNGGLYNTGQNIILSSSEAGHIYYTLNGETPTVNSPEYTSPIVINQNTTLKFFAIDQAGNPSPIYTENYQIDTTKPEAEADLKTGSYNTVQFVNLSINEPGRIFFTTNGSAPTTSSKPYLAPLAINKNTTLKFIAVDEAGNISNIYSENYIFDTIPPTAQASVKGGLYNTAKTITLTSSEAGNIYYTINGDTPTSNSTKYNNPISIVNTTTLKFFAEDEAGNSSSIYTEKYEIDKIAPKVSSTTPSNNKTNISRTSSITIKFSKNIKSSSNYSKIIIKNLTTGKTISLTKTISSNLLSIKFSKLSANTWYQVTIPSKAVKDFAGNYLMETYTFKFKTGA
jgi:hypothetical protein